MKKDVQIILDEIKAMREEITQLKKSVNEIFSVQIVRELEELKNQIYSVSVAKITEDGKESTDSFGNLILDELISLAQKIDGLNVGQVSGVLDGIDTARKEIANGNVAEVGKSLTDLMDDLKKLVDIVEG